MTKTKSQKLRAKAAKAAAAAASARPQHIKGQGDYLVPTSSLKQIGGKPAGEVIGKAVGKVLGSGTIGKHVGGFIHRAVKHWTGFGDYKLKVRALKSHLGDEANGESLLLTGKLPEFERNESDGKYVTFSLEETIAPVFSSTGFAVTQYRVNPGVAATFPSKALFARTFESCRVVQCIFQLRSFLSDNAAGSNGVLGQWGMCTEYNVPKAPPSSFQALDACSFSDSERGSCPVLCPVECDPKRLSRGPWFEVSYDGFGGDTKWTDHCVLNVATAGYQTNGARVGDLRVVYKIQLDKDILYKVTSAATSRWKMTTNVGNTFLPIPYLGNNLLPVAGSSLGGYFGHVNGFSMPKIPGNYQLTIVWSANTSIATGPAYTSGSTDVTLMSDFVTAYSGNNPVNGTWRSIVSGNVAMLSMDFVYTAATSSAINDILFSQPTTSAAGAYYTVEAWLYVREDGLRAERDRARPYTMSDIVAALLAPSVSMPGDIVTNTIQSVVSHADGTMSVQAWPYAGPIPPQDDDSLSAADADDIAGSDAQVAGVQDDPPRDPAGSPVVTVRGGADTSITTPELIPYTGDLVAAASSAAHGSPQIAERLMAMVRSGQLQLRH